MNTGRRQINEALGGVCGSSLVHLEECTLTLSCKPAHVMEARVSQKLQEGSAGRPAWGSLLSTCR